MYKLDPDIVNQFEYYYWQEISDYKQKLKESLDDFTEEVISNNLDWFKERKTEYLISKLAKIQARIDWWETIAKIYPNWFGKTIIEVNVNPDKKEMDYIRKQIDFYQKPKAIDYNRKITEDDIQRVKSIPLSDLIEIKRKTGNVGLAICPFHNDHKPSLNCYDDGHYHCFTCGAHGDSINLTMRLNNLNFMDAVKFLRRY